MDKIIHYTWKNENLPHRSKLWIDSWKSCHPDWEFRFWTNEDIDRFIYDNYKQLTKAYDGYKNRIQKVDAVRYCLLHKLGGLYIDIDIECYRPIDELVCGSECSLFEEYPDGPMQQFFPNKKIITNSIFYAKKESEFMGRCIKRLSLYKNQACIHDSEELNICMSTGPGFLTKEFYSDLDSLKELHTFNRFESIPHSLRRSTLINGEKLKPDGGAFGMHWNFGSWIMNKNSRFRYFDKI